MARKLIPAGIAALLAGLVVVGLVSAHKSNEDATGPGPAKAASSYPLASAKARLDGSPKPLAALHDQSSDLLGGGTSAFRARLKALRGYPVVVNKWGSWCGPCRDEFPHFQRQAAANGKRVAFLGVDGQDNDDSARTFLRKYPVAYPSYIDGNLGIAKVIGAVQAFPSTVFYDSKGQVAYIKQGNYATERALAADIRRYAR